MRALSVIGMYVCFVDLVCVFDMFVFVVCNLFGLCSVMCLFGLPRMLSLRLCCVYVVRCVCCVLCVVLRCVVLCLLCLLGLCSALC